MDPSKVPKFPGIAGKIIAKEEINNNYADQPVFVDGTHMPFNGFELFK